MPLPAAVSGLCRAVCGLVPALAPVRAQLGQSSHSGYRFGQVAGHLHGQGFLCRVWVIIAGQVDRDGFEDGLVEPFALFAHGFAVELAGVA
ncbi:MAG TPA: hypothetical protein VIM37_03205 [Candidatus Microsaccharimonas sp.]